MAHKTTKKVRNFVLIAICLTAFIGSINGAHTVLAADCTYTVSLTVTPNTVNPADQDNPIVLQAHVETNRGTADCDNFFHVVYYIDGGNRVGDGGTALQSSNMTPVSVTLKSLGVSSGSVKFRAAVIDQAGVVISASPIATLTISSTAATGDCDAYLFFKDSANPTGFTDYRTIKPADGAKMSVVAEIKKCQGQAGVTKLVGGQFEKFLKNYFTLDPTKAYSFPFSNELSKEGKYDFYLDWTPNSTGKPTQYKHIQINISNTASQINIPDNVPITNVPNYDSNPNTPELEKLINTNSIPEFLASLIKFILLLMAGLSVIVILIGAFRMAMSQGKSEALTAGKKTITWAIIGLVVALLSYSIVAILQNVLGA